MGRLIATEVGTERITSDPKAKKSVAKHNKAVVNTGDVRTALHEGKHLLKTRGPLQNVPGVAGSTARKMLSKMTKRPEVPVDKHAKAGHKEHAWITGNELYNARNKKEADAALSRQSHVVGQRKMSKAARNNMADTEYGLGARLMYDPSRGHGARKVAKSAMESVGNERATYKKYRDQQSYIGRGQHDTPQYLKKMSKQPKAP